MTKAKRKPGRKRGDAKGRTKPGPLTPTGGNHREATETAARIERQRQAWQLYVYERLPMRAIAEILSKRGLPCTTKTVGKDIHEMASEARTDTQATMRHGLDIELQRLDHMDRQLLPLAMGDLLADTVSTFVSTGTGRRRVDKEVRVQVPLKVEPRTRLQLEALEKLRRNSESRRKLLGMDKQPDEGFVAVEQVVAMVRGLVSDVLAITAAHVEVRKQLGEAMRKRFRVIDGEAVERA